MLITDTSQDWKFWYTIGVMVLAVVPLTYTALTTESLKQAGMNRWLIYAWVTLGYTFVLLATAMGIGAILVGPIGPTFTVGLSSIAGITLGIGMIMLYRGMKGHE